MQPVVRWTHWGRVTHLCVDKLTIIGSDKALSPGRRQAIIWTNARILLIGLLGTNFSEILIEIQTFSLKKMRHIMVASLGMLHMFILVTNNPFWKQVAEHLCDEGRGLTWTSPMWTTAQEAMLSLEGYRIICELEWRPVYALARGLSGCLFPELRSNVGNKYQNNIEVGG